MASVLKIFQHLSKQWPHKPELHSQRGHGLSALLSKKHCRGTSCIKVNEHINLPVETQALCVSHKCFIWNTALQVGVGEWKGGREGSRKGRIGLGKRCTVKLALKKKRERERESPGACANFYSINTVRMANCHLPTWHDSQGVGKTPAPSVLVQWDLLQERDARM